MPDRGTKAAIDGLWTAANYHFGVAVFPRGLARGGNCNLFCGRVQTWEVFSGWVWWLVVLTVLVVLRYGRGVRRLVGGRGGISAANQVFVYLWLFIAFAAVAPPIDTLARDLYFVHQVQHMLLHMVAPLLLALGVPLAPLIAGITGSLAAEASEAAGSQSGVAASM